AYNKRYTGNTVYKVSGPAASAVGGTVVGTLNNCSSGHTPWGTYLTCEETTDNYLDPTQPEIGYGWVVEIDPLNQLAAPTKRTA
ncbi:alkaline phosphatase PhoX, partial [Variovorax sp. 2RAF20]